MFQQFTRHASCLSKLRRQISCLHRNLTDQQDEVDATKALRCSDFVGGPNNSKNHWRSFPNGFYTNLWLLCVLVAIVLVYAKNLSCQFDFFLGWSRYTFKTILDSKLFPFEYSECMVWKYIDTIYII
mgnify:CR=1 FL=1